MKKYIGNKDKILNDILLFIKLKIGKNKIDSFFDVFAGTNNVGYFFKKEMNLNIISNDVNKLSYVLGKSYIELNEYPSFSKLISSFSEINNIGSDLIKEYIQLNNNGRKEKFEDLQKNENKLNLFKIFTYLSIEKLPKKYKGYYNFIHRNYCENGENSNYTNRYGISQKRMFFSDIHGERIDDILNLIIKWRKEGYFNDDYEYYVLLSGLIEACTLFSNTSGVYESYYKKLFPNAKQQFRIPYIKEPIDNKSKNIIYNDDILNLVNNESIDTDILYLDPPYNSREYSSNYHLLNLVADFHNVKNPKEYEKGIILGRGQHKDTIFKSSFCRRLTFIKSMEEVISKVKCKYVFISHYNGNDNLWNSPKNEEGFKYIKELLSNEKIFKKGSFDYKYIDRQNFQSGNGLKKDIVREIIFFAEKLN